MNSGIIVGIVTICISIFINYLNLYGFADKYGNPIKHWLISYYISWFIAVIPFLGFIVELTWLMFGHLIDDSQKCTNKLFAEI